jgi:hypothetical protein
MTRKAETSEGTPSLVFFRSAEEERRIFFLLFDYVNSHAAPSIRPLLSVELQNLAGDDRDSQTRACAQQFQ